MYPHLFEPCALFHQRHIDHNHSLIIIQEHRTVGHDPSANISKECDYDLKGQGQGCSSYIVFMSLAFYTEPIAPSVVHLGEDMYQVKSC